MGICKNRRGLIHEYLLNNARGNILDAGTNKFVLKEAWLAKPRPNPNDIL